MQELLFPQIDLLIQRSNFTVTREVSVFFLILICTQFNTLHNDDE